MYKIITFSNNSTAIIKQSGDINVDVQKDGLEVNDIKETLHLPNTKLGKIMADNVDITNKKGDNNKKEPFEPTKDNI